jgi:hypothetical protein
VSRSRGIFTLDHKRTLMKKLILFAVFCLLLQGCVGVGVLKTHTKVINDPEISLYSNNPSPDDVGKRSSPAGTNAVIYTTGWLQTYWGHPNSITRIVGSPDEIWTYKSRLIWEGVIPFVIIPIPLVLPVRKEKVCFTLHDGRVINASITQECMVGGTYGVILSPEGGGGFGAMSFGDKTQT